jgi:diacylglycerol O-acyltransferase / wax synthase
MEWLSGQDLALRRLERAAMPLHFGVLAVFGASPSRRAPAKLVRERAARVPELRQRIRPMWFPWGAAAWAEDPRFRVSDHVASRTVRQPGDLAALADLVAELMAAPLPLDRPLWSFDVIRGLAGQRWAILARLHHAVSDGPGAVELGLRLFDGFPARQPAPQQAPWFPGDPLNVVRQSAGIARDMVSRFRLPEQESPLHGTAPPRRQVEFLRFPLTELRAVQNLHGGTVNDILLAMVAGALRRWTRGRIRALIPVDLRPTMSTRTGRNQVSAYLCDLPVAEPDPVKRLRTISAEMQQNKAVGPRGGPGAFPLLAERIPAAVHRLVTPLLTGVAPLLFDLAVTNVRLPSMSLALGGSPLEAVYPVAPLPVGHRLSVAICGYGDSVNLGVYGDPRLDLRDFGLAVADSLGELVEA